MLGGGWDWVSQGLVCLVKKLTIGSGNPLEGSEHSSDIFNVHLRKILKKNLRKILAAE